METDIKAVICDLDGVITDTARQHARAWKATFDRYNERRREQGKDTYREFSIAEDYPEYIDGVPRYDGVERFLQSRDIDLPYGSPEDAPEEETICGLGNAKNERFHELLETEGVTVLEPNVSQVRAWRDQGLRTAIISSSRNCRRILELAGLTDLFEVRIDGVVSEARGIPGKPAPDIFLAAARDLQVEPAAAMVVEDSLAGISAGAAGDFGLLIAIEGAPARNALLERGADRVVRNLQALDLELNKT